jgi:hypothetical protein
MALQISYTDVSTKLVLPAAYVKIHSMLIDAVGLQAVINMGVYVNAAAKVAGGAPMYILPFNPPFAPLIAGPIDLQAAIYTWLKTQPLFAGALDV